MRPDATKASSRRYGTGQCGACPPERGCFQNCTRVAPVVPDSPRIPSRTDGMSTRATKVLVGQLVQMSCPQVCDVRGLNHRKLVVTEISSTNYGRNIQPVRHLVPTTVVVVNQSFERVRADAQFVTVALPVEREQVRGLALPARRLPILQRASRRCRSPLRQSLHDERHALSTADAHRHEAGLFVVPLQGVQQGGDNARSRHAERVP